MNDVTVGDVVSVTWKLNDLYIQKLDDFSVSFIYPCVPS